MLRAAGDATRLRLLLLLLEAELAVSELTQILGQSQPRISRHLKLLCEAGLLERFKEGSWVFYRASDEAKAGALSKALAALAEPNDATLALDRRRLVEVRAARENAAAEYFKTNAAEWERIRALHVPEDDVEKAVVSLVGDADAVLDAGTGSGRMLEVLAPHIKRGVGLDIGPEMLAIARDRLARANATNCQVRLGDVYRLPLPDGRVGAGFDVVILHQILHFLDDPQSALREAARVLKPGGRVLIVDFAPHALEFLRDEHKHRRLGFSDREVQGWLKTAGLKSLDVKTLAPRTGEEKLTVMIWLAQAPLNLERAQSAEVAA